MSEIDEAEAFSAVHTLQQENPDDDDLGHCRDSGSRLTYRNCDWSQWRQEIFYKLSKRRNEPRKGIWPTEFRRVLAKVD